MKQLYTSLRGNKLWPRMVITVCRLEPRAVLINRNTSINYKQKCLQKPIRNGRSPRPLSGQWVATLPVAFGSVSVQSVAPPTICNHQLSTTKVKKGEQIKSYLTQHRRITATSHSHSHTSMFKNYLSALGLSYSFINKVYEVLVCIHLITILIQKVMIQCVISAVPRCVLNRLKVTRFKIQPTTTT